MQSIPTATPISTPSSGSVATTATYMSDMKETSVSSNTTLSSQSPLVHPYEQALVNSRQAVTSTPSSSSSPTVVPTQQWESYSNQLYNHVLSPHSRHKHMTHIVTLSERDHTTSGSSTIPISGRYLSVYDVNTKHDIFPNPKHNILKEMTSSTSQAHTRSSSQKAPSISRLQNALALTMPTHTKLILSSSYSITAPNASSSYHESHTSRII